MAQEIKITAQKREAHGSAAARRFRRSGAVPAVLAKTDKKTCDLLALNAHEFERTLSKHLSDNLVVTLSVGEQPTTMALIREIQRDPLSGKVIHADFIEIARDTKLRVQIPLFLLGDPEGVRTQGGVLTQMVRQIEVSCLPQDVVEKFTVDVSALKLNESIMVADLKLGDAYAVLTHGDVAVAMVAEIKEEVVETVAADATATAEGAAAPAAGAAGATPAAGTAAAPAAGAKPGATPAAGAKPGAAPAAGAAKPAAGAAKPAAGSKK